MKKTAANIHEVVVTEHYARQQQLQEQPSAMSLVVATIEQLGITTHTAPKRTDCACTFKFNCSKLHPTSSTYPVLMVLRRRQH